jgi:putative phosphoribosyl transferase
MVDLTAEDLAHVSAATLVLAGDRDLDAIERARETAKLVHGPPQLTVVEGAGRLFAEPGTLETAARLAAEWFAEHLDVKFEFALRHGVVRRLAPGAVG